MPGSEASRAEMMGASPDRNVMAPKANPVIKKDTDKVTADMLKQIEEAGIN